MNVEEFVREGYDISLTQVEILVFCREYLTMTQHKIGPTGTQIARALGITPQAVGYHLKKLRKRGYIQVTSHMRIHGIRRVRLPGEPPLEGGEYIDKRIAGEKP